MKNDKFLIGIVAGIVLLVIVSVVVVLLRQPSAESYVADDNPAGVVHNYFLAIQREEYEKAYGYLSDNLKNKPDLDTFSRDMDIYGPDRQSSLTIGETTLDDARSQVDISITTYSAGGLFDNNQYTSRDTVYLEATADGSGWRINHFPYPYWQYDWDEGVRD
ncbi:MAG: hypothetical protein KDJ52_17370 [Anaerolineae bacterium]|nr:hypothetical protein [Anaerolineae bacterium]